MAHHDDAWIGKRSGNIGLDMNALSFPEDYDDGDELADLPSSGTPITSSSHSDRVVRRRSSKGMSNMISPFDLLFNISQLAINVERANANVSVQQTEKPARAASCWGRVSPKWVPL